MPRTCARCGGPIDLLKPGRVPTYCSTRCRVAANRAKVPAELRERDRWVRHERKRPITAAGSAASSTDPGTWSSYAAMKRSTVGDGIGFVLGDGIGCFDLDHCLVNGRPTAAAAAFLAQLPATYVEISPSGSGLHVWGLIPPGHGSRRRRPDGLHVERYSTGRYITVTGRPFAGSVSRLADLSEVGL